MSVERVAADANVLLSAVIGKAALRIFTRARIEVVSTAATLNEVREYLEAMSEAYGIALEILEGQFRLLAVTEVARKEYLQAVPRATRLIGARDPDDVELLALALARRIPVWSNDADFSIAGVRRFTTTQLLKELGV